MAANCLPADARGESFVLTGETIRTAPRLRLVKDFRRRTTLAVAGSKRFADGIWHPACASRKKRKRFITKMRQDNNYAGRRSRGGRRHRRNSNDGAPRSAAKAPVKLTLWQKIKSWFGGSLAKSSAPKKTSTVVVTSSSTTNGARKSESTRPARKPEVVDVTSPKLYVGNLSFDASESDLFELFKGVGSVQNAEIVSHRHTQKSKGFAFVMMQTVDEARRAVTELHDKEFMGRKLVVSGAKTSDVRYSSSDTEAAA